MNAVEIMDSLRLDDLKPIIKQAGLPKSLKRKSDIVVALNQFLKSQPAALLERMTPIERNLLSEAVYGDNCVDPFSFSAKYDAPCPAPLSYGKTPTLVHALTSTKRYESEITIPQEIADLLRPFLPEPMALQATTVEQIPETLDLAESDNYSDVRTVHVYSAERTVFVELRRMLQLVQGGKVRVQAKSGRPTPATERAIAGSLVEPDFDLEAPNDERDDDTEKGGAVRAHAWPVLLQQCGWCKATKDTLGLTKAGKALLDKTTPDRFRKGLEQLAQDDDFDELQRINNIRGQTGKSRDWMSDPSERRETILDGLAEWPVGEWMTFKEAYRFLNACGHVFIVTDNPMSLYMVDRHYGSLDNGDNIDRQYLRVFFLELLATLGIIDVGYVYPHYLWPELGNEWGAEGYDFCGRYDGLLYVRLNPLGAYCLGLSDQYTPPAAEVRNLLTVLPNHDIAVVAGQRLLPGDISMLELFASKKSNKLWHMDRGLLLDYFENGGSLDDITRFLTENSQEEIPARVRAFFNELQANLDVINQTEDAWLIEFQDPGVASLIADDSRAGKLCVLAGERHLAVAKSSERAFRKALKNLGYVLPR